MGDVYGHGIHEEMARLYDDGWGGPVMKEHSYLS